MGDGATCSSGTRVTNSQVDGVVVNGITSQAASRDGPVHSATRSGGDLHPSVDWRDQPPAWLRRVYPSEISTQRRTRAGARDASLAAAPSSSPANTQSQDLPPLVPTAPPVHLAVNQDNAEPSPARESANSRFAPTPGDEQEILPVQGIGREDQGQLSITSCYDEIVHWRKQFFRIPTGSIGKAFVNLLVAELRRFTDSAGTDCIALYRFSVLPSLMLQSTRSNSKPKENTLHLQRRMALWQAGNLTSLMSEGRCLQDLLFRPRKGGRKRGEEDEARHFSDLMCQGRVHDALRCLDPGRRGEAGGVLNINDTVPLRDGSSIPVKEALLDKHPEARLPPSEAMLPGDAPGVEGIRFDGLTAEFLKSVAMHSEGSAGPSGMDSACWRRMCSSFKGASTSLCQAIADLSRLLATRVLPAEGLVPFLSCRLIALDKQPGVRPIGVGEVLRRIVSKAILRIASTDVEAACGHLQKCAGSPGGQQSRNTVACMDISPIRTKPYFS